jgi:hypothetical protein
METVKKYVVLDGDTRIVRGIYNNQAPATSLAKAISKRASRRGLKDPLLTVEERTYVIQSVREVRKVINGNIFDATSD